MHLTFSAGKEIDPLIVLFNEFIFMKTIGTKGNNSDNSGN